MDTKTNMPRKHKIPHPFFWASHWYTKKDPLFVETPLGTIIASSLPG